MLTLRQAAILDILQRLSYLRQDQLFRLAAMGCELTPPQFERDLRQLRYLGKLMLNGDCVLLPERRRNFSLIAAVDVMLKFVGGQTAGFDTEPPPFCLSFLLEGENGRVGIFKVLTVQSGSEADTGAQVRKNLGCTAPFTTVFLIGGREQVPLLRLDSPHFFALVDRQGEVTFFKGSYSKLTN